ncbi:MAG: hypothetical protein K0Q91_762, partial [Fibrobacteria bacterium]|nr:hypothetical protein [Fibrobacteria bacterium]
MPAILSKSAKIRTGLIAFAASAFLSVSAVAGPNDSVWIQLFNPKDTNLRNDWDIKIRGEALNVD